MTKLRVGVIGASAKGGWGTIGHLPALKALPEQYEVTAVAATRQESADEVAKRFGVKHAFASPEPLVQSPDVDLVVVCVKVPEHDKLTRLAIEAGKHVFCEWPLGVNTAQAEGLAALAAKKGVRSVIGLQRRLSPGIRYLGDLLAEGYVGKVRSITVKRAMGNLGARRPASMAYTADVANGASALTIFTAHFLDTVLAPLGELRELSSVVARQFETATVIETGEVIPVTAPDQVLIAGTLSSGAVLSAHFEAGKRSGAGSYCTITGTEGDLVINGDLSLAGAKGDGKTLEPLPVPERYRWVNQPGLVSDISDVAHLYAAFAKDVAEGSKLAPDFTHAVRMHRLLDTIAEASRSGQRQRFGAPG